MKLLSMVEVKKLQKLVNGDVLPEEPLYLHTSLRIGGPADVLVIPRDIRSVYNVVVFSREHEIPLYVIGNGTNVLVRDEGVPGIVLKISNVLKRAVVFKNYLICGASISLSYALKKALRHSLSGLEACAGIPGTIGGAIAMNAGSKEGCIGDVVEKVVVMDESGNVRVLSRVDCKFRYRESVFQESNFIILQAVLSLRREKRNVIIRRVKNRLLRRLSSQPLNMPSAGCVFKNPPNCSAGELIDRLGLKGLRIGGAMVSHVHANFIVNIGGATAKDVLSLIAIIRDKVYERFSINLDLELKIIPPLEPE